MLERARRTVAPLLVATAGLLALHASPAGAEELASVAALRAAQAEYAQAGADVVTLTQRLDDLQRERAALDVEEASLTDDQRRAADELAGRRQEAQRAAVAAYITGGGSAPSAFSGAGAVQDQLVRTELSRANADHAREAARAYVDVRAAADTRIEGLVDVIAANAQDTEQVTAALAAAQDRWRLAEVHLREADRVVLEDLDSRATEILPDGTIRFIGYVASGSDGGPTPDQSGNAKGRGWDLLRHCESGGNYAAVSPGGLYRGAYQFDVTTWRGVGGDGDPALNPPAEQDYRAQILYNMRGPQPWPICGRHLREDPSIVPHPAIPPPPPGSGWVPPSGVPPVGSSPAVPPPTTAPATDPPPTTPPPTDPPPTDPPPTVPPTSSPPTPTTTTAKPTKTTSTTAAPPT